MVFRATRELWVQLDLQDHQDLLDLLDCLELKELVFLAQLDHLDHLEILVPLGRQVPRALKVHQEAMVTLVQQDKQDQLVQLVLLAHRVQLEGQVQ